MTRIRSLRARALSIAVLAFLVVVLLGLFSLWRLDDYHIIVGEIRERYLPNTQFLGDLNNSTSDFRAAEAAALLASSTADITDNANAIDGLDRLIGRAERGFERIRNDPTTNDLYSDFASKWRRYRELADQVVALSKGSERGDAITLYRTRSGPAYDLASDALGLLTERNRREAADSSQRADLAYREARYLTAFAVVAAVLIAIGGLVYVRRTILLPLLDLARRMHRLADNDMNIETDGIERGDEVGEMARAILVFRNNAVDLAVSQQALAQQATMLGEKLAHEQHLSELQRNFLSMASHEFRTPLTVIDGQAQRLINAGGRLSTEDIAQRARNVRAAVSRMTGVIDNLIGAARLADGEAELYFHPGELDLVPLLREVCQVHRELTPRARIAERLPAQPLLVHGDQKLLSQVFHNIVSNAIKYSPQNGTVSVSATLDRGNAAVSVEDRGLGIAEADRARLFERYYRGGNVAGIVGSGIGLYLVKTVLDLHGADIAVESVPGQGSRFTVRIPALSDARAPLAAAAEP